MLHTKGMSQWLFILICIFSGVGILLAICFLIFNIRYRNLRIVKMSSPNLNLLISLGGILLYGTCLLYGVDYIVKDDPQTASILCQVRAWVFSLSFTLMYASMFIKSWRVHRIFKMATVKRLVIRDEKLIGLVCAFMVFDVVVLSLWQGIDPLVSQSRLMPRMNRVHSEGVMYYANETLQCCSSEHFPVWISLIYIYKGVLLLYGTYLSWAIRNVTLPAMNDSKYIIISAYTVVVCGGVASALAVVLNTSPDAVYGCITAAIWIATTTTQCLVFVPKIKLLRANHEDDMLKLSMTSQIINSPSNQSFEQIEEEMYHLVAENRALKKSLTEKETTIKNLEGHVQHAKSKLLKLMDQDGRQDSGLDVDISTSSVEENEKQVELAKEKEHKENGFIPQNVSEEYNRKRHGSTGSWMWNFREQAGERRPSNKSIQSWQKISRLRDSIAQDLETVEHMSTHMRESIAYELTHRKRDSRVYDDVKTRQDLAGAIADSYDLTDDSDTYSYVSNYLGYSSDGNGGMRSNHSYRNSNLSRLQCSSCESVTTLENDSFYPNQPVRKHKRKHKWSKRIGHRNTWKREPRQKVYTIQDAQQPQVLNSAVAVTRTLNVHSDPSINKSMNTTLDTFV